MGLNKMVRSKKWLAMIGESNQQIAIGIPSCQSPHFLIPFMLELAILHLKECPMGGAGSHNQAGSGTGRRVEGMEPKAAGRYMTDQLALKLFPAEAAKAKGNPVVLARTVPGPVGGCWTIMSASRGLRQV